MMVNRLAKTDDPAVAADVAERLNEDEDRRDKMVRLKVATSPNLLFDGRTCRLNGLRSGGLGPKRQLRFGRSYRGAGRLRGLSGGWGMDDAWTLNLRSVPRTVIYDNQRQ
jgi:hypothetical protein